MPWYKEKRSIQHIGHALIMSVVFILGFSILFQTHAIVNFNASGLFGQFQSSVIHTNEVVNFDVADPNNNSTVNSYGLYLPKTLALDSVNHRLFVSDIQNRRVMVFNLDGSNGFVDHEADFVIGQANFTTNAWNAGNHPDQSFAAGNSILPIAYDSGRNLLFVSDTTSDRIMVFDVSTITNGEAAIHAIGPGVTSTTDLTNSNSQVNGLAVDPVFGLLYATTQEEGSLNYQDQVQIYDISGSITDGQMPIHYLGEDGGSGVVGGIPDIVYCDTNDKALCSPSGVAAIPGQGLFVADVGNDRVLYYDFSGGVGSITDFMSASNVVGAGDFTTAGACTFSQSDFCFLGLNTQIAYNGTDTIFINDTSRILCFYIGGGISDGLAGSCSMGGFFNGLSDTDTSNASGLAAVGPDVWVGDTGYNRVIKFPAGGTNPPASDVLGQLTFDTSYVFGSTPLYTQSSTYSGAPINNDVGFNLPRDVAIDTTNHRLFVADTASSSVRVFNLDSNNDFTNGVADAILGQADTGTPDTTVLANRLHSPNAVAYDSVGNRLFVSDTANGRVLVFDTTSADTNESAIHVLGKANFTTNTAPGSTNATELTSPYGIAYDAVHGKLFVSDSFTGAGSNPSARILVYDTSDGITDGEAAIRVLGQANLTANANYGTPTAANISVSNALHYDSTNNLLYATDYTHNRVLVYDTVTIINGEAAVHVLGSPDFSTINGSSTTTSTIHPVGLSLDETGNQLYVSTDDGIERFDVATIVDNEPRKGLFATDSGSPSQYQSHDIYGLDFDSANNRLYAVDNQNSRVLYFDFLTIDPATPVSYSGTVGQAFTTTPGTSGSQGTVKFEVVSGTPPAGITFDTTISGTPTVAGSYTFSIRALDEIDTANSVVSAPLSISMNVAPAAGGGSTGSGSGSGTGVIIPTTTGGGSTTTTTTTTSGGTPSSTTPGTTGSTSASTTTPGTTGSTSAGTTTTGGATGTGTTSGPTTGTMGGSGTAPSDPTTTGMGGSDAVGTDTGTDTGTGTGTNATTSGDIEPPPYDDDCPGNLFNTVVCIVKDSLDYTEGTLSDTIGQIRGLMSVPSNDIISKLIGIVGILAGALFTLLPVLFTNPLSFSEILLLPARLWSLLLVAFGIKKRNRPWGRVYDSITKQPLDPVYVSLQDNEGNEIASSITDIDGRYGFLVEPGKYRMIPKKTHYSFPSAKLIGKTRDELYLDLYFGYIFEVKEAGEVITKNIPMDPDTFDWNEFAKQEQTLMRFYSKRDRVFARIADIAFSLGLTVSTIALIVAPTAYNITIFALYILLLIVKEVGFRQKSSGTVVRKGTDIPVPFAIVRIISKKTGVEVLHKVTNILGRYYALVGNGTYDVTIETKNPDGSYTLGAKKENVEIKNGLLKERLEV